MIFFFLDVALSLVLEQGETSPWLSPVLVLPVLQLLSCSSLTEPLADRKTHNLNQELANNLLSSISRRTDRPRQVARKQFLFLFFFFFFFKYRSICLNLFCSVC